MPRKSNVHNNTKNGNGNHSEAEVLPEYDDPILGPALKEAEQMYREATKQYQIPAPEQPSPHPESLPQEYVKAAHKMVKEYLRITRGSLPERLKLYCLAPQQRSIKRCSQEASQLLQEGTNFLQKYERELQRFKQDYFATKKLVLDRQAQMEMLVDEVENLEDMVQKHQHVVTQLKEQGDTKSAYAGLALAQKNSDLIDVARKKKKEISRSAFEVELKVQSLQGYENAIAARQIMYDYIEETVVAGKLYLDYAARLDNQMMNSEEFFTLKASIHGKLRAASFACSRAEKHMGEQYQLLTKFVGDKGYSKSANLPDQPNHLLPQEEPTDYRKMLERVRHIVAKI